MCVVRVGFGSARCSGYGMAFSLKHGMSSLLGHITCTRQAAYAYATYISISILRHLVMSSSEGTNPQIRNVSFNLEKDILGPDSKLGSTSPEMNKTPPKSALKRRQSHMLPPPDQYQHSDPLLRRLRLIDGHGKPVNLKKAFRDTKIVIFYFGSQWNARETKGCQKVCSSA